MENKKRLIDADALAEVYLRYYRAPHVNNSSNIAQGMRIAINSCIELLDNERTVDAVEVDGIRAFAKDVAYQFGYYCQNGGRLHITHGGLSTLEWAFDILGWENPHPAPEFECEIDGCHEHATCGAPTVDGYKRMCSRHFRERRTDND